MTRREIVDRLRRLAVRARSLGLATFEGDVVEVMEAVEALPDPEAVVTRVTTDDVRSAEVAFAPGDRLISLKGEVDAGARIIIEPGKSED